MKRHLSLMLLLVFTLIFVSCGKKEEDDLTSGSTANMMPEPDMNCDGQSCL